MPTVLTMEATFTIERSRAINSVRIVAKNATKAEDVKAAVEKVLQTGATGTAVMRALYDGVEQGTTKFFKAPAKKTAAKETAAKRARRKRRPLRSTSGGPEWGIKPSF